MFLSRFRPLFCWLHADNTLRYRGEVLETPGLIPGAIWPDGDTVHYVDQGGVHRTIDTESRDADRVIPSEATGYHRPTAIVGSIWIEGDRVRFVDNQKVERVVVLGRVA